MTQMTRVTVSVYLELEAPKLVSVKAHTRILKDKIVMVRSHYRRVWVRK